MNIIKTMIKYGRETWATWCRIHAEAGTDPRARAHVTGSDRACAGPTSAGLDTSRCTGPVELRCSACKLRRAETSGEMSVGIDPATRDGIFTYPRQAGKAFTGFSKLPGAPDDSIKTARLRRLIELGLVSEPAPDVHDMIRVESWHTDREQREAGDPSACPCSGRHFPSPSACRWCRCHDPKNVHHSPVPMVIEEQVPVGMDTGGEFHQVLQDFIDQARIRASHPPCNVCGSADHAAVNHTAITLHGLTHVTLTPLEDEARSSVQCTVCGHAPHGAGTCQALTDDGAERCGCGGIRDSVTQSAERPSAEIVLCSACGHPQHYGNDRPVVCGYPYSTAGGHTPCSCTGQEVET